MKQSLVDEIINLVNGERCKGYRQDGEKCKRVGIFKGFCRYHC